MDRFINRFLSNRKRQPMELPRPAQEVTPIRKIDLNEQKQLFAIADGLNQNDYIMVQYKFKPRADLSAAEAAARLTIATSLRSPRKLPLESSDARISEAGRVLSDPQEVVTKIALPVSLLGEREDLTKLLALVTAACEYDYTTEYWISQLDLPLQILRRYHGPSYGIQGLRSKLSIYGRPILGASYTAYPGVDIKELASHLRECLIGGIDYVTDDVLLVDPESEYSFERRLSIMAETVASAAAATGEDKAYAVHIMAAPRRAAKLLKLAQEAGAGIIKVNGFAIGIGALNELIDSADIPVIATNMGVSMLTRPGGRIPGHIGTGISESVVSKLSRVAGADGVHLGSINSGCYVQENYHPAILALQSPMHHIRPAFIVAGDNINLANMWDNIASFGDDIMIEANEGLLAYPYGPGKGAAAMRLFAESLPTTMSIAEGHDKIESIAERDHQISRALDYFGYKSQHEQR